MKRASPFARITLYASLLVAYFGSTSSTSRVFWGVCTVSPRKPIFVSPPLRQAFTELNVTRPGVASSLLVSDCHIVAMTSWLTIPRSHWEMFPHNREVPEDLIQELTGILLHAGIGMSGSMLDVV